MNLFRILMVPLQVLTDGVAGSKCVLLMIWEILHQVVNFSFIVRV